MYFRFSLFFPKWNLFCLGDTLAVIGWKVSDFSIFPAKLWLLLNNGHLRHFALGWCCKTDAAMIRSMNCLSSNYTTNFEQQRHVCIRNSCADCFLANFPSVSLARVHTLNQSITVIIRDLISRIVLCIVLWSLLSLPTHIVKFIPLADVLGCLHLFGRQFALSQVSPHLGKALCQDSVPFTSCRFLDLICKPHRFHLPNCFSSD